MGNSDRAKVPSSLKRKLGRVQTQRTHSLGRMASIELKVRAACTYTPTALTFSCRGTSPCTYL